MRGPAHARHVHTVYASLHAPHAGVAERRHVHRGAARGAEPPLRQGWRAPAPRARGQHQGRVGRADDGRSAAGRQERPAPVSTCLYEAAPMYDCKENIQRRGFPCVFSPPHSRRVMPGHAQCAFGWAVHVPRMQCTALLATAP
eukprot:scaffold14059_cov47-Phaeocystis_antarctica.AAC.1